MVTATAAPARNRRPATAERVRPHAVYAAYSAAGDTLYVGMSWRPDTRWREHRTKPWHHEINHWTILGWYPNWTQAKAVETFLIDSWQPRYNIAENPAWRHALDSYATHTTAPRRADRHLATIARLAARVLWTVTTLAVALAVFLITLTASILTNGHPPTIHCRRTRRRRRRHR
jgi:hypothetical protein